MVDLILLIIWLTWTEKLDNCATLMNSSWAYVTTYRWVDYYWYDIFPLVCDEEATNEYIMTIKNWTY